MSNPAYLWLTDENGSPMIGSSLVARRVGAIKIKTLTHSDDARPVAPSEYPKRLTGHA